MAKMDNVLDKQVKHLERIEQIAKTDRLIQLGQLALEKRIDDDEKKDTSILVRGLENVTKAVDKVSERLSDTGALAKRILQLGESIKVSVGKGSLSAEQAKGVTEASMKNQPYFKTLGDRMTERKEGIKNFFTMRGFLDKTGIVSKGSGGMFDTAMARREAKQQYVNDRMKMEVGAGRQVDTKENRAAFAKQFDRQQKTLGSMQKNEKEISRLQEAGYSEKDIQNAGLLDTRNKLATQMTKDDPRARRVAKEIAEEQDEKKPKIVKKSSGATESTANKKAEAADLSEEEIEAQKVQQQQLELLTQIEENTRPAIGAASAKPEQPKSGGIGDFLGNIMSFLGDGIMKAVKFLFNPRNLLKVFTKFIAPAMIIGSLVNGLMDGFKAWQETGSIAEALIAGLGGILDFLTFGLIDAETIKSVVDWVSGFVDEYIITPITEFFDFIGDAFQEYIVDPLKSAFEPVIGFFKDIKDSIFGFFEKFEIPGISFSAFGKQFGFGPWYPFKSESTPKTPAPSTPSTAGAGQSSAEFAATDPRRLDSGKLTPAESSSGNQVASASSEAEMAKASQATSAPVVIAPQTNVSNNSAATYAVKSPVRNPSPPTQRSRYAVA